MAKEFCNIVRSKTIESFVGYQKQFKDYQLFSGVIKLIGRRVRA